MADNKPNPNAAVTGGQPDPGLGVGSAPRSDESSRVAAQVTRDARQRNADLANRRATVQNELAAQQEEVMANSRPTPTQKELDAAKLGMPIDDAEVTEAPSMPPLAEQQARVAEASGQAPYRTRAANARK
jgi:hypothetical protein